MFHHKRNKPERRGVVRFTGDQPPPLEDVAGPPPLEDAEAFVEDPQDQDQKQSRHLANFPQSQQNMQFVMETSEEEQEVQE